MSLRGASSLHIGFFPEELERVGPKNLGEGSTRQLSKGGQGGQQGYTTESIHVIPHVSYNPLSGLNNISSLVWG